MLPNSDKAVLKFEKIFYIYKKLVSYLYETVTCITTKGKERKMPGKSVDIKLRKNNSVGFIAQYLLCIVMNLSVQYLLSGLAPLW